MKERWCCGPYADLWAAPRGAGRSRRRATAGPATDRARGVGEPPHQRRGPADHGQPVAGGQAESRRPWRRARAGAVERRPPRLPAVQGAGRRGDAEGVVGWLATSHDVAVAWALRAAPPVAALMWEQPSRACYALTPGGETQDPLVTGLLERRWQLFPGNSQIATLVPLWLVARRRRRRGGTARARPAAGATYGRSAAAGMAEGLEAERRCALVTGTGLALSRGGAGLLAAIGAARIVTVSVAVVTGEGGTP
jgi:hypothetical protein